MMTMMLMMDDMESMQFTNRLTKRTCLRTWILLIGITRGGCNKSKNTRRDLLIYAICFLLNISQALSKLSIQFKRHLNEFDGRTR